MREEAKVGRMGKRWRGAGTEEGATEGDSSAGDMYDRSDGGMSFTCSENFTRLVEDAVSDVSDQSSSMGPCCVRVEGCLFSGFLKIK